MNLTLVIPSLLPGGAERVMSLLANAWAENGWQVTILSYACPETDFYKLHPTIRRVGLDLYGASQGPWQILWRNFKRLRFLRREIRKTEAPVVLSFLETSNILTILACQGLGVKVIIEEHNDPALYPFRKTGMLLRRWFYPTAQCLVVLSGSIGDWFREQSVNNIRIIPNPVLPPSLTVEPLLWARLEIQPSRYILAAAGRLTEQKGFDLLVEAFAHLAKEFTEWNLVIFGEGEQRSLLETQITRLGLKERVFLPGIVDPLSSYLSAADAFVLSSRTEGFPMVLVEAMACGLPIAAVRCTASISEIVEDGVTGLLIPKDSAEALEKALERLMSDPTLRQSLAQTAPNVLQRYGLEHILSLWDDLFHEIGVL